MSLSMSKSTQTLIRAIESTGMYEFPDGARYAAQDIDGTVKFYATKPRYVTGLGEWDTICSVVASVKLDTAINHYHKTLVTKAQFEVLVRLTPRPSEPKPYTRDEALQFLVERLDSWPTDIADAPLCPGWGWSNESRQPEFEELSPDNSEFQAFIGIDSWQVARPDFVPFVSVEDAQPIAGQKFDTGKPIIGAIPPHAELAVARVMTFGAQKYARDNWRKIDDIPTRYMDAALRHLNAVRRGETVDPESGEHHLAHAACCILFMLDVVEASDAQTDR